MVHIEESSELITLCDIRTDSSWLRTADGKDLTVYIEDVVDIVYNDVAASFKLDHQGRSWSEEERCELCWFKLLGRMDEG